MYLFFFWVQQNVNQYLQKVNISSLSLNVNSSDVSIEYSRSVIWKIKVSGNVTLGGFSKKCGLWQFVQSITVSGEF